MLALKPHFLYSVTNLGALTNNIQSHGIQIAEFEFYGLRPSVVTKL